MFKTLVKCLIICALCAATLTACDQQKQASAEIGAIPKTIIDKATNEINAAEALATEQAKTLESIDAPAEAEK
jgi:hypothetical protein